MKLVNVHQDRVVVNSLEVAKHFEKRHSNVLRAIENIECSEEFAKLNFELWSYEVNNRKQPCYLMTKDGFSLLIMGFTGKKAAQWREKYINAFNQMEKKLLKQQDNLEWKLARTQTIGVRKSLTDTIQRFVEYAESQGSTKAKYYYSNITKMEYKALNLVQGNDKSFRDTLNTIDLGFLIVAENICMLALDEGMNKGLHYKDIYQLAKDRVVQYASVINGFRTHALHSFAS